MGDEIATAEALLTVCSFHASNAAPRAPAPKHFVNIHKENLKYLPLIKIQRAWRFLRISPSSPSMFSSFKLLDRETPLQVGDVLLQVDQRLKVNMLYG